MNNLLILLHVLGAVVFIGTLTFTSGIFTKYLRRLPFNVGILELLHNTTKRYAIAGLVVPVLGIILVVKFHILTSLWVVLVLGMSLIIVLLLVSMIKLQSKLIGYVTNSNNTNEINKQVPILAMLSGIFALLWVIILMLHFWN